MKIARDFDDDTIVISIKRGREAGGFARFLEASAEAILLGKIQPTNAATARPAAVADELRKMVTKIEGHNA